MIPKLKVLITKDGLPHIIAVSPDWTKEKAADVIRIVEAHEGLVSRNTLLESVLCNHIGWHCEEGNSPTLCKRCIANIKGLIRDKAKHEQALSEAKND